MDAQTGRKGAEIMVVPSAEKVVTFASSRHRSCREYVSGRF